MVSGSPFPWLDDVSPANWVAPVIHPELWVAEGFEAYCRIFHPVEPQSESERRRRWADVARQNRRIVHAQMQFHLISRPLGAPAPSGFERGHGPQWGSLPWPERKALYSLLRAETTTPETCWFCVWEGYGGLDARKVSARVELPGRGYVLYQGPIESALASVLPVPFDQSPNLWWPDDRAWFVSTEIDFAWTYVGGSTDLVDSIVGDNELEAIPALLTDKPFYDSDLLNEALDHS